MKDDIKRVSTYCFDLDGTLCQTVGADYENAVPLVARIQLVNDLFKAGNTVVIFTARGSTTGIDWRELTEWQLNTWGVQFHRLLLGKPFADHYVDDKAVTDGHFFAEVDGLDLSGGGC